MALIKKSSKAADPRRIRFQYAAKFICTSHIPGTSQTSAAVLPGTYMTCVNIHNPGRAETRIRMKLASSLGVTEFIPETIAPDGVTRVTCGRIQDFNIQPIHGFEGFVVIESPVSLDVVAVYTAGKHGAPGGVESIDVEQVPERVLR